MKNPADSRPYYFYTPHEIACARDIISAVKECAVNALRLYPASWITWAAKVLKWKSQFNQVLRAYVKRLKSASLAIRAIWDNLKGRNRKGRAYSVSAMLKALLRPRTPAKWQRKALPAGLAYINPKAQKTERRASVIRMTAAIQTPALQLITI